MINWERKAIQFMTQTNKWDLESDCEVFLPVALGLLKSSAEAYLSLQLIFEDSYTIRVKDASPSYLEDFGFNPAPVKEFLAQNGADTLVFWKNMPQENNPFEEILLALSSAVIIPVICKNNIRLIILGWSEPQDFTESFREFMLFAHTQISKILNQTADRKNIQQANDQFIAIMNTVPKAIIYIDNKGHSGWINRRAAELLQLSEPGEHAPAVLATAMAGLKGRLANLEEVNAAAARLFTSPEAGMKGWIWKLARPASKTYIVDCMHLDQGEFNGGLWVFEEITPS